MIIVYSAATKEIQKSSKLEDLLLDLPATMHSKAFRYRFAKDAYNYVLGRLLLKKGLLELNSADSIDDINFAENDKPFLPHTFFNISHSEGKVVCAISGTISMGIDIEYVKPVELHHFKSFFSPKEWDDIHANDLPLSRFYWYWTRKESIIKALGQKLDYLHQIEIDASKEYFEDSGQRWYLQDLSLESGYVGALCSAEKTKIAIKSIDFT